MKQKTVFYALMTLLTLGVCASLVLGYYTVLAVKTPFKKIKIRIEGDYLADPDRELGFVPTKNASSRRIHLNKGLDFSIFTDHLGARVTRPGDRTASQIDVLVIGGSFAWGHGVENEHTFAARLAEEDGLEVANVAMGSYGTLQALQMLQRYKELEPRYVVYAAIEGHLSRNLNPCAPAYGPFCLSVSHVVLDENEVPSIRLPLKRKFTESQRRQFMRDVAFREGVGFKDALWKMRFDLFSYNEVKPEQIKHSGKVKRIAFRFLMQQMVEEVEALGAQLIVVFIPRLAVGESYPPSSHFLAGVRRKNLELLDLQPVVAEHYERESTELLRFENDGHPNERGHRLIYEHLSKKLRTLESAQSQSKPSEEEG